MTSDIEPSPTMRRERTAGHVVAIVIGVLALLPAFGLLGGGTALLIGDQVAADDDGFFRYTLDRVESDGVAVAATDLWLDEADGDSPWIFDWLDVDLRVRAEGVGATDEVFIGVARTADVERYLDGAAWSEVLELDGRTAVTDDIDGREQVLPPADAEFWSYSVSGSSVEELTWPARDGRWSVVVMNADGSAGVSADVELGARSGALTPIAVTMMSIGGVVLILAVVSIVLGSRGRRAPGMPSEPSGPAGTNPHAEPTPPLPDSAPEGVPSATTPGAPLPPPSGVVSDRTLVAVAR